MAVGFGIFLPLGVLCARYGKNFQPPIWYQLHQTIQVIGLAMGFSGFIIGVAIIGTGTFQSHQAIGWIVMIIAILQPLNAIIRPHRQEGVVTVKRWIWYIFHSMLGRVCVLLALTNIFLGLLVINAPLSWFWTYFFWISTLGLGLFVAEGKRIYQERKISSKVSAKPTNSPSDPEVETDHDMGHPGSPHKVNQISPAELGPYRRSSQSQV